MNGRELLQAIYDGEPVDRLPVPMVHGWMASIERWRREGLPADAEPNRFLGLLNDDYAGLALNLNMVPTFPVRILDEGPEYVTLVDEFGVTKRMMRIDYDRSGGYKTGAWAASSMSHWIDFPVKDLRSWKTIYEERFGPGLAGRVPENWDDWKAEYNRLSETRWSSYGCFPLFGLFGPMRELMGLEGLIYAIADDPGLVHTIIGDLIDFWLAIFSQVLSEVRIDQVTFFEDMCATKAPLMSPAMYREFLSPGYRKIIGGLREMGVRQFWVDTDGNAWRIIPEMLACGITGIAPCEAQADMDVERLREAFPTLCMGGGIAKKALVLGTEATDAEVDRCFRLAWEKGRYLPALDHAAPPDIPWAHVRHFADRCNESVNKPPSP